MARKGGMGGARSPDTYKRSFLGFRLLSRAVALRETRSECGDSGILRIELQGFRPGLGFLTYRAYEPATKASLD